ncbi:MAG TPA: hypothetical protein VMM92_16530 [Thermoanaerobaculia bacterium]|nr:hypothetical protein [Thermoanaerobaculia bacterium]
MRVLRVLGVAFLLLMAATVVSAADVKLPAPQCSATEIPSLLDFMTGPVAKPADAQPELVKFCVKSCDRCATAADCVIGGVNWGPCGTTCV